MMLMLLVFFIATDMKIKVLGELDFVSCFFILLVKAVTLRRLLYSPSLSLKTLDTGILLLAVFTLELEMDYPSETSLCTVAPSPQTPILQFFLRGGGGCTQAIWN